MKYGGKKMSNKITFGNLIYRLIFGCPHEYPNILMPNDLIRILDLNGKVLTNGEFSAMHTIGRFTLQNGKGIEIIYENDPFNKGIFVGQNCIIAKFCPDCFQQIHEFRF